MKGERGPTIIQKIMQNYPERLIFFLTVEHVSDGGVTEYQSLLNKSLCILQSRKQESYDTYSHMYISCPCMYIWSTFLGYETRADSA